MNIHDAIMKAADHIEQRPDDFRFAAIGVPECGTPGCALGWISAFSGFQKATYGFSSCLPQLGLADPGQFYDRLCRLEHWWESGWMHSSKTTAKVLRRYARKYHKPAPRPAARLPDWNAIASRQTVGEHERSQELA